MRILLALVAMIALLAVSGCGAVDDATKKGTDTVRQEVADQCKKEAEKITDAERRKTTLETCEAARNGNSESVRETIRKQCFDRARDISDSNARKEAEKQCNNIGGSGAK